jgi:hypothetical protein
MFIMNRAANAAEFHTQLKQVPCQRRAWIACVAKFSPQTPDASIVDIGAPRSEQAE